jgi:hypothetical protein
MKSGSIVRSILHQECVAVEQGKMGGSLNQEQKYV